MNKIYIVSYVHDDVDACPGTDSLYVYENSFKTQQEAMDFAEMCAHKDYPSGKFLVIDNIVKCVAYGCTHIYQVFDVKLP